MKKIDALLKYYLYFLSLSRKRRLVWAEEPQSPHHSNNTADTHPISETNSADKKDYITPAPQHNLVFEALSPHLKHKATSARKFKGH